MEVLCTRKKNGDIMHQEKELRYHAKEKKWRYYAPEKKDGDIMHQEKIMEILCTRKK